MEDVRLGDLSADAFAEAADQLDAVEKLRAQHFFTETQRVADAGRYWAQGDTAGLGQPLDAKRKQTV